MTARLLSLRAKIGGDVHGARGTFPGPGHSRRDRSLSLWDVGARVVAHSFASDSWADIRDMLAANGVEVADAKDLSDDERKALRKARAAAKAEEKREAERKRKVAFGLWGRALPLHPYSPAVAPAYAYLRGRGIEPIDTEAHLRFLPRVARSPYSGWGASQPALTALVVDAHGASQGLHLTYLAKGERDFRLMLGPQAGGCVRLAPAQTTLAIAEGIETALSYTQLHGVPCWAARSSTGLEQWRPPSGVENVIIAADNDEAGLTSAHRLGALLRSFVHVQIHAPKEAGDWNDVLHVVRADHG